MNIRLKSLFSNRLTILVFGIAIGLIPYLVILANGPYNQLLTSESSSFSDGKTVVKIDDATIGKTYLDKRILFYKKNISNPASTEDYSLDDKILKNLIDNYLILEKIRKSGFLNSKQAREEVWPYIEQILVDYYLDTRIKYASGYGLSEKEIDDFYLKNTAFFEKNKISEETAKEMIKNQLNKIAEKSNFNKKEVLRKIELGRIKKNVKIEINPELYKN